MADTKRGVTDEEINDVGCIVGAPPANPVPRKCGVLQSLKVIPANARRRSDAIKNLLAFLALVGTGLTVYAGGLLDRFEPKWVVLMLYGCVAVMGVIVWLETDKLGEALKPVIAAVALSLVPAIYQNIKEQAAHDEQAARDSAAKAERISRENESRIAKEQEQAAKVAAELSSMRAAVVQFASECSPQAIGLFASQPDPVAAGERLRAHLSSPTCASKYDEIVRGWVSATWTYRLLAPSIFLERHCGNLCENADFISIACKVLEREGTDRVSRYYRRFVNANVDCCTSPESITNLGSAIIGFFNATRRLGCALMLAVPELASDGAALPCRKYMDGSRDYLMLEPDKQLDERSIMMVVDDDPQLDLAKWWGLTRTLTGNR